MPTPTTPAGRLVSAFGDPARMAALYAPHIEWSLPASLSTLPRPMVGRDAVAAFNRAVWEVHYFPDCTVEILDETGDAQRSAVRFIYRATARDDARTRYENHYTLFARSGPDGITEVFEDLDTLAMVEVLRQGRQVGDTFRTEAGR
ncbi:MAG: nuclear transport factor 2 family protein [Burkholderiales bacterium]